MTPDPERRDIAVVGMAGRFPGAASVEELWRLLASGKEGIVTLADTEPPEGSPHPPPGPYVPRRGVIDEIDCFDAGFFKMSGAEADLLDPQHRLMLEVAWEALEDAGLADCDGQALGVFASTGISQYLLQNLLQNPRIIEQHGPLQLLLYNDKDTLATRLSYFLNIQGPSLTVQTGCSSSLVALHLACRSLREEECTAALVGGVSLALPQDVGYFYSEQMIHSRDGCCRAFDDEASGTLRGNGACAVVLKPLTDALRMGDPIRAVIKGSAVNNDGREKVGFTAPSPRGQAAVITTALERSGVAPDTIGLIEAHGTGTPLGDPVEAQALKAAFRGANFPEGQRCAIGAGKSNLGHLDAAAGLTGFIKACLSLSQEAIPPVVHFRRLNSHISFEGSPFFVNAELRNWPRGTAPRRAGVNAFGIGGTNVHVIVEEAPAVPPPSPKPGPHLLAVSATTASAFTALCERYRRHIATLPAERFATFAYSTLRGRKAFEYRAAWVVADADEAMALLERAEATVVKRRARRLEITQTAGSSRSQALAERLAALGVEAAITSSAELRLTPMDQGVVLNGPDGTRDVLSAGDSDSPRAFELALVAALWELGVRIDWMRLFPQRRFLPIPSYPFARERHWIDPVPTGTQEQQIRPRGPTPTDYETLREAILSEWRELIGKPDLRAEENLFESGATSLLVGQFISRFQTNHGLSLSPVDCYREPTVSGLTTVLAARLFRRDPMGTDHSSAESAGSVETFMDL